MKPKKIKKVKKIATKRVVSKPVLKHTKIVQPKKKKAVKKIVAKKPAQRKIIAPVSKPSVVVIKPKEIKKFVVKESSVFRPSRKALRRDGNAGATIKVVGVGGGGGNAVSRMVGLLPRGVEMIAINTDVQDLHQCEARKRIYIGKQTTKGLGAGMNPELGRQSAEENREEIANALAGADVVFLTAGFGGGTGTGALPVVAEIAKEMGILTIAIVTKPFSFEGAQRSQIAQEGVERLKDRVDTYITIPNDRIFSMINNDTSLQKAFIAIDEVLRNAVIGVSEVILSPGIINVDFADIKTIIENSGVSLIGVGIGSGKERALMAANMALNSPLLESSLDGAKGVLFSISGHRDLKMNEVNEVAKLIAEHVDPGAKIIFGAYYDRKLNKGQLKVTLIATGFGSSFGKNYSLFGDLDIFSRHDTIRSETAKRAAEELFTDKTHQPTIMTAPPPDFEVTEPELSSDNEEESAWDVPAFLRRKKKK